MALCLDNMQRTISFKPLDTVEMLLAIFGFLRHSSRLSQVLLEDFKQCQGYLFLVDFLLKVDQDKKAPNHEPEHGDSVAEESFRKLIPMIVSWCSCGYSQAPPLHPLPDNKKAQLQLQGFRMPHVTARGTCVRNIYAFQVLQTVFLRSTNASLCCTILDAIMVVYRNDDANYFILESQNTLCLFAEKIHQKQGTVQLKFFELIEFIVFQLNFIPRKELIALSVLLKTNQAIDTSIACTRTFLRLLSHNSIFNDVYREVGILEVFTTCMKRYKEFLEKNIGIPTFDSESEKTIQEENPTETNPQEILGRLVMEAIVQLLSGNSNNTSVFKNSGGSKCIYEMIKIDHCNNVVLKIVKELVSTAGGEDDMLHLLKSINTTTDQRSISIPMRIHVLHALIDCLKESHRTRSFFRKVGGFVYVVNVLDLLKGQFTNGQSNDSTSKAHIRLFRVVCQTLNAAMRFEPANAKYFQNEIANTLFYQAILDLGCFSKNEFIHPYHRNTADANAICEGQTDTCAVDHSLVENYSKVFKTEIKNDILSERHHFQGDLPRSLVFICIIYRALYDIVLDAFDRPQMVETLQYTHNKTNADNNSGSSAVSSVVIESHPSSSAVLTPTSLNVVDNVIVHPSVIVCMLKLLPSVEEQVRSADATDTIAWQCSTTRAIALQFFLSEVIKSFVRSERNQQIMCDGGLNECILRICKVALIDEHHPLHMPLQYIFERLAVQALMPKELRTFLRLNLNIEMFSKDEANNSKCVDSPTVPLTRVKTLVSITTPRDFRAHGSFTQPPFIEMDMSTEGFACLFFPNIAPNQSNPNLHSTVHHHLHGSVGMGLAGMENANSGGGGVGIGFGAGYGSGLHSGSGSSVNVSGHQQDSTTGGGIGTGDRIFPANSGLTFSTWFCVDRFPHPPQIDSHPIRLLHIVRSDDGSIEDASVVFSVLILPSDKTLSVATQEFPFTQGSFQDVRLEDTEEINPLVQEERLMFGVNPKAYSHMTLSKIRKVYNRTDAKAIGKQLGMSSHENATPIVLLHNSSGHLTGSSRTLGGVLVGYLGIRHFNPFPVSMTMNTVGGCSVLLGLVAMSHDIESLYAAVKALTCILRTNKSARLEMNRRRYYQTLGMLYKRKKMLLNSHILHLTFNLVGTVHSGYETSTIPNVTAFQKVTGGLTRLTSRSKLKKEGGKRRVHAGEFRAADIRQLTTAKLTLVRDYWEFRLEQHCNSSAHTKRYVYQDWLQSEAELIRERAIWGPECCADFTKWTLDSTEGPYRMRKKMLKNELFYVHYPPRPELDVASGCDHQHQRQLKCRVAISHDSGKNSNFVRQYRNMFPEQFEPELAATAGQTRNDAAAKKSDFAKSHRVENGMQGDCLENEEDLSSSLPDNQVLLRLLEEKEKRGEISNFQYLMHLNSLAGRSYNDLMQYPVFPWILSNYDCDTLDLNEASNFRDLSKPMGAQTQERLKQFQKRYEDWDDPQGDTPPYHYGTHYSSAMIVCSYLVRLEPFTQNFLRLQGGHFDLADRLFHSVKEAWFSASRQNMADVKELVPEFFYLPEFLENANRFDLGTKQNGEVLNDVVLPPWAKNDPREFIRMHREALECDYVSRNLHLMKFNGCGN
uniref:BEACH domain-containing protein n=1 Tax=Anopheles atroparvus TaxID=41427 RepID=A0A182IIZ4_ANOAO